MFLLELQHVTDICRDQGTSPNTPQVTSICSSLCRGLGLSIESGVQRGWPRLPAEFKAAGVDNLLSPPHSNTMNDKAHRHTNHTRSKDIITPHTVSKTCKARQRLTMIYAVFYDPLLMVRFSNLYSFM